jgi:hypothetical protein
MKPQWLARLLAWVIAFVTIIFSTWVSEHESPLTRMIVLVLLQLMSMKILVVVETYSSMNNLRFIQWVAFSLGWFGMKPSLFESFPSGSLPYSQLLLKGLTRIIVGFLLLYLSTQVIGSEIVHIFFLKELLLLAGLSFILHFGILNLSAASWRMMGVNVGELFRSPYRSKSLKEFWGKRWNIAFSEMTALVAYRPLKATIGAEKAITVSFLFSGLLHEVAISLPVKAGYGLPMLYFIIHAVAMRLEARSTIVQKIIRHRILSHVWVVTFLILPMPLLFHRKFVLHVLEPLRDWLLGITSLF